MRLFIVALSSEEHKKIPDCAHDALLCARKFSGCEVVALSDMPHPEWIDANKYMHRAKAVRDTFLSYCTKPVPRYLPNSMRYFIIHDWLNEHGWDGPICQLDWDQLVFQPLEPFFKSFNAFTSDLRACQNRHNGIACIPLIISSYPALIFFTETLRLMVELKAPTVRDMKCFCDITLWRYVCGLAAWSQGNDISIERDDEMFDVNMTLDKDLYYHDARGKALTWVDGKPYFKRLSDGGLVKAICLHTFLGWRYKTGELMKQAGLTPIR